ncbi:hypothetical protein HBH77_242280 [Parastagonospora nodorum]|nr:hypothetical protein HBH77_242280 [Parastagonospora nodorum]
MHASLRKELEVRHSLLNLSVYNLVEEFARHVSLYSVTIVFVYPNANVIVRYSVDKYSKKYLKVCKADALKQRLESEAQLRKASEEEELAKTKKEKREKEAWERKAELDSLLDSDDYCLDSSLDINSKDNLEDKEATTAKDLDSLSARNKRTIKLLAY